MSPHHLFQLPPPDLDHWHGRLPHSPNSPSPWPHSHPTTGFPFKSGSKPVQYANHFCMFKLLTPFPTVPTNRIPPMHLSSQLLPLTLTHNVVTHLGSQVDLPQCDHLGGENFLSSGVSSTPGRQQAAGMKFLVTHSHHWQPAWLQHLLLSHKTTEQCFIHFNFCPQRQPTVRSPTSDLKRTRTNTATPLTTTDARDQVPNTPSHSRSTPLPNTTVQLQLHLHRSRPKINFGAFLPSWIASTNSLKTNLLRMKVTCLGLRLHALPSLHMWWCLFCQDTYSLNPHSPFAPLSRYCALGQALFDMCSFVYDTSVNWFFNIWTFILIKNCDWAKTATSGRAAAAPLVKNQPSLISQSTRCWSNFDRTAQWNPPVGFWLARLVGIWPSPPPNSGHRFDRDPWLKNDRCFFYSVCPQQSLSVVLSITILSVATSQQLPCHSTTHITLIITSIPPPCLLIITFPIQLQGVPWHYTKKELPSLIVSLPA